MMVLLNCLAPSAHGGEGWGEGFITAHAARTLTPALSRKREREF